MLTYIYSTICVLYNIMEIHTHIHTQICILQWQWKVPKERHQYGAIRDK